MQLSTLFSAIVIVSASVGCLGAIIEPKAQTIKVFNYQGALPPIKDDRTGEVIRNDSNETEVNTLSGDDGEACWNLIVERSTVTFALQNRVLNELQDDLKDLQVEPRLRGALDKLTDRLRLNMKKALEALKDDSAEDYFDALFDTSEGIIQMSSLLREPEMDDRVFLALVKAVSRLGRNNTALVQEFIDQCSLNERSPPRPRALSV